MHGAHGPVSVSSDPARHELIEAAIAAENLGVPANADFNGATQEGVGYYQLTTRNGLHERRQGLSEAGARRGNLEIVTDAQATSIIVEQGRARGISYRRAGGDREICALRRGVVPSAGALQSPQLLMLSGIGPADHLHAHGVAVLHDRREVGRNLQDHLQFRLIYRCTRPITTNDDLRSLFGRIRIGLQWALMRSRPLAIGINQGGLFTRVMPGSATPDIQFHIVDAQRRHGWRQVASLFRLHAVGLPAAAGESRAYRTCLEGPFRRALRCLVKLPRRRERQGLRRACDLFRAEACCDQAAEGSRRRGDQAGSRASSDEDILEFARASGATIFHPPERAAWATIPIPSSMRASRARGVDGLWVADCSVMPRLVSGNTNLPAIAIGERAAEMILADATGG